MSANDPTLYPAHDTRSYKRVGGWLLLLCISLVILTPLGNFAEAGAVATSHTLPLAFRLFVWGISGFAIYAGVNLWRVTPGAVRKAKAFLWTNLACGAGLFALLAATGHSFNSADAVDIIRSICYFSVWYSYLNRSVRVKHTYGAN